MNVPPNVNRPAPVLQLLRIARAIQEPGESAYEAAERAITYEAVAQAQGVGREAARIAGVSARVMCYMRAKYGLRRRAAC